jgi:hypothetical protein
MERNCFLKSTLSQLPYSSIVTTLKGSTVILTNNFRDNQQTNLNCPYVMESNAELSEFQCRHDLVFNRTTCPLKGLDISTEIMTLSPNVPPPAASIVFSSIPTKESKPVYIASPTISELMNAPMSSSDNTLSSSLVPTAPSLKSGFSDKRHAALYIEVTLNILSIMFLNMI